MKYILYGANRVAKDFLYMFEDLQIVYFIDDEYEGRMFLGYPVARPAELNKRMTEEQIILCDFDKTKKETRLLEMGLVYGKIIYMKKISLTGWIPLSYRKRERLLYGGSEGLPDNFVMRIRNMTRKLLLIPARKRKHTEIREWYCRRRSTTGPTGL